MPWSSILYLDWCKVNISTILSYLHSLYFYTYFNYTCILTFTILSYLHSLCFYTYFHYTCILTQLAQLAYLHYTFILIFTILSYLLLLYFPTYFHYTFILTFTILSYLLSLLYFHTTRLYQSVICLWHLTIINVVHFKFQINIFFPVFLSVSCHCQYIGIHARTPLVCLHERATVASFDILLGRANFF